MVFMDQNQCIIEEMEVENSFDMEEMAPYSNTEEETDIEVNMHENKEKKVYKSEPRRI